MREDTLCSECGEPLGGDDLIKGVCSWCIEEEATCPACGGCGGGPDEALKCLVCKGTGEVKQ